MLASESTTVIYLRVVRRSCLLALVAIVSVAVAPPDLTSGAGASPGHRYAVWMPQQAREHSPLLGLAAARHARPGAHLAAEAAFGRRVDAAIGDVRRELGAQFGSAAIDPVSGQTLVVSIAGRAAGVNSPALAELDGRAGRVRIVENQPSAAALQHEYAALAGLVGGTIAGARVLRVARDDMSGRVVAGVDARASAVSAALSAAHPYATVLTTVPGRPTDGGTWGNNPSRYSTPVAGGESIVTPAGGSLDGCTSTLTATRNGAPVVMTAGHCVSGASGATYLGNDRTNAGTIGTSVQTAAWDSSGVDAAAIANTTGSARSCIVTAAAGCVGLSIAAVALVQGQAVSFSGATSGDSSATVTAVDSAELIVDPDTHQSETITDALASSNCTLPGDSGGPLYLSGGGGANPVGILAGGNCPSFGGSGYAIFSRWSIVCGAFHIDSADCPAESYVFWKGTNGSLYQAQGLANGSMSGPYNRGMGPLGSAPSAGVDAAGRAYVYWEGQAPANDLYEAYWDGNSWIGPVNRGMGPLGSPPTVAITANGSAYVFWKGTNGALYQAQGWADSDLSGPYNRGMGPLGSAPSAGVDASGRTYVYWQGQSPGYNLYEGYWDGGWQGPYNRGMGPLGSGPAMAVS